MTNKNIQKWLDMTGYGVSENGDTDKWLHVFLGKMLIHRWWIRSPIFRKQSAAPVHEIDWFISRLARVCGRYIYSQLWRYLSLTWNKAIWEWFLLLTMIPVKSQWGHYNLPRHIALYMYSPLYVYILLAHTQCMVDQRWVNLCCSWITL